MSCCSEILVGAHLHWPGFLHRAVLKSMILLLSKRLMRATWIWMLDQIWKPWELQEGFNLKHSFNILESSALAMPSYGKPQLEGREKSQNFLWQFIESQKNLSWRSSNPISCTKLSYLSGNCNTSTRKKILRHTNPTQWHLWSPSCCCTHMEQPSNSAVLSQTWSIEAMLGFCVILAPAMLL